MPMFDELNRILKRPAPFEFYTSATLWNDPHISKGMLAAHLDSSNDAASYKSEFIDRAVEWMASRFGISKGTRVCDFGCGPGNWTRRFAALGAVVTGLDFSERSIRHAEDATAQANLAVRYVLGDYLQFSTQERFDLITMISRDFSVLSPEQRSGLLQTFAELLSNDGRVILDVSSLATFRDRTEGVSIETPSPGSFWSPHRHHLFTIQYKYDREHLACGKYVLLEPDRETEIYVWDQCYTVESLEGLFGENGLQIADCYSDVSGEALTDDAPAIAVVAGKSAGH